MYIHYNYFLVEINIVESTVNMIKHILRLIFIAVIFIQDEIIFDTV